MRALTYVTILMVASTLFTACDDTTDAPSSQSSSIFSSSMQSSDMLSSSSSSNAAFSSSQSYTSYSSIASASDVDIRVDFSEEIATYRSFLGLNKPPVMGENRSDTTLLDLREGYKFIAIDEVRMHDSALDICKIFTADKLYDKETQEVITGCKRSGEKGQVLVWSALKSPLDDSNYDFSEADSYVGYVKDVGAKVYLRLGDSYDGVNDVESIEDYAKVATKIYSHYESMGIISDVEIHNEPDGGFWMGESEDFYAFVNMAIDNLRAKNIPYNMGGNGFTDSIVRQLKKESPFITDWFTSVDIDKLDFVSAHYYGDCDEATLADYEDWTTTLRLELDSRSLEGVPLHITEWNIGLGEQCGSDTFVSPKNMSFAMGVIALSQDSALHIDKMFFYAGTGASMSLFSPVKGEDSIYLNPAFWAFYISKELKGSTVVGYSLCKGDECKKSSEFIYDNELLALALKDEEQKILLLINNSDSAKIYGFDAGGIKALWREKFSVDMPMKLPLKSGGAMKSLEREALLQALERVYTKEKIVGDLESVKFTIAPHSVELIRY